MELGGVIPHEMIVEIRRAFAQGKGLRAIASEYGISHHTARRYRPDDAVCACGLPTHSGLCKEKHAASPGMVARALSQKGIDNGYRRPKPRSRLKRAQAKFDFVFGLAPDWECRARKLRPSQAEHYGIIGEVNHVTRTIRREYRDDVRQELMLACFEGRVPRAEIAQMVKPFLYREMKYWIGSFSSILRSLNAPAGYRDGDSKTYLDLMTDGLIDAEDLWNVPTSMWWERKPA